MVSLVISTYNWPEALELCLKSVYSQTLKPNEIVIADDGSQNETKETIDKFRNQHPDMNIKHVWHEDDGFRLTVIRNKAIKEASGDYIIQIDGDIVLDKHFIEDHVKLQEPGYYVCGSRVKLNPSQTERMLREQSLNVNLTGVKFSFFLNTIRIGWLRSLLAKRYGKRLDHLRGCNIAFWRKDFIAINGYNEDLLQWGHEDGEMILRMHYYGVRKKFLKMGGVAYHLYHKEASNSNEQRHFEELEKVSRGQIKWCKNGIDKYLI